MTAARTDDTRIAGDNNYKHRASAKTLSVVWWCIIVQCIMCMCHENNYTIFGARHAQYDVSHNAQRFQWLYYSRWRMAVRRVLDWHNRRKRACCVCRRRAAAPPPALRLCQQHTVDIHTNGHRTVPRKKCTVLFATPSKLCLAPTDMYNVVHVQKPTAKAKRRLKLKTIDALQASTAQPLLLTYNIYDYTTRAV